MSVCIVRERVMNSGVPHGYADWSDPESLAKLPRSLWQKPRVCDSARVYKP